MIGVDTNVLAYAVNSQCPEHEACREVIQGMRAPVGSSPERLALPWSVAYEFLRVVTHPRFPVRPLTVEQAWGFVTELIERPHVAVVGPGPGHDAAASRMLAAPGVRGNLVHDAHIAAVLAEHGIRRIYTRDQDFHRFPGLEVVDPLA
jgi:toxin-antitoxin system PIN domain toxin